MIIYILKTILCSAVLILIYQLFLEKEKMHGFNRFYLLFATVYSFIIPFVVIKAKIQSLPVAEAINLPYTIMPSSLFQPVQEPISDSFPLANLLVLMYVMVTAILLCRFIVNISTIYFKIKNNDSVKYLNAKLILTNEDQVPHSFLNYILVPRKDFEQGSIKHEILSHELTHVNQRHSLDILFIELLMVFAWINPVVFWFKKTIQLNHEFLADDYVIKNFNDTRTYQLLLVNNAAKTSTLLLSSSFNYLLTKKRIIMMKKEKSPKVAILKQMALIPVIVVIGFLFTTKNVAQNLSEIVQEQIAFTQEGVSQEVLKEYQEIEKRYSKIGNNGQVSYWLNPDQIDKERLETIFFQMSKEQQTNQVFAFIPCELMVLPKTMPTEEQVEAFKDPEKYGVWIDGEQVNNSDLDRYKNSDFASVFVSGLTKTAKNYGKYDFQVNLMTNEGYKNYIDDKVAEGNCLTLNR